jgi:hypothetical protein
MWWILELRLCDVIVMCGPLSQNTSVVNGQHLRKVLAGMKTDCKGHLFHFFMKLSRGLLVSEFHLLSCVMGGEKRV